MLTNRIMDSISGTEETVHKEPLVEKNVNVAKVLPLSKLPTGIPMVFKRRLPVEDEQAKKRQKLDLSDRLDGSKMMDASIVSAASGFAAKPVAARGIPRVPRPAAVIAKKPATQVSTMPAPKRVPVPAGAAKTIKPPVKAVPVKPVGNGGGNPAVVVFRGNSGDNLPAANTAAVGKKRPAWDTKGRLQDMEEAMSQHIKMNGNLQQQMLLSNERIVSLEMMNSQLKGTIQQREQQTSQATDEIAALQKKLRGVEAELDECRIASRRRAEKLEFERSTLERRNGLLEGELAAAREEVSGLRSAVAKLSSAQVGIEAELSATKINLSSSEGVRREREEELLQLKSTITAHLATIDDAHAKLRDEETARRQLHNMILELKGNIRVFVRVRPLLGDEALGTDGAAIPHMNFPDEDHRILELERLADVNPNESTISLRKGNNNKYEFTFDRVFDPAAHQKDVFAEISQLVQSALDGYNVCIFAYGQTGSGKTYTMEGPDQSQMGEQRGMIARAVEQVFATSARLVEKGWRYEFEMSFLEIYNEMIRDLLGNNQKTEVKHEIRLVNDKSNEVYVTELTTAAVTCEEEIHHLLRRAANNRSVAETRCNERSSRSHSVFRMKITGANSATGESGIGLLNLIDLAGSERLKESGSQGARLKETQSINKSLANLGNVIMALSNKDSHVPYRNSKLTHLLQNCLGGRSKCLMFVNVSPKEDCFHETVNSLRFAMKVNECNIGTAIKKTK